MQSNPGLHLWKLWHRLFSSFLCLITAEYDVEQDWGWYVDWLLGNGRFSLNHKSFSLYGFQSFSVKNRHSSFWLYKLLSLHYVHKLMHSTIIEVLLLSHKYPNISLSNEVGMVVTYFAGWCWSRLGCCNGRNRLLFGRGLAPHMAYQPWDLQCGRCSVGQSLYGQWPHPDPAETKTVSDENNTK